MDVIDARLQELIDREQIRDCLFRYCRGVDRGDEAALRSAYWADATDEHGAYSGPVEGFIQWAMSYRAVLERTIHQLGNILIDFRAGGAVVETYWNAYQRGPKILPDGTMGAVETAVLAGRYADWFESRGGEWRIARRRVIFDRSEIQATPPGTETERFGRRQPIGGAWPSDPIYGFTAEV